MSFAPLNALSAFLVVARRRSFARAAKELAVTPSALSQSVRNLEERLGTPLLTRTTRSVALTDAGKRLLEQAGPAIDQALESLKTATARPGEVTGKVRITVPAVVVPLVIEPLVPRFVAKHPRVDVEVQVDNRRVDIVNEGFDAGIRLEEFLERDMIHLRLSGQARFVVVASPSYVARRGAPSKPEEILAHDCVCLRSPTTGGLFAWDLERGRKVWHVPVRGPIVTNEEHTMIAFAKAGLGLAYAFEPAVRTEIKKRELVIVLEAYAAIVPGFFLFYPSRAQVSRAFRAFIDVARDFIAAANSGERSEPEELAAATAPARAKRGRGAAN
jgi:DNA-binding transcriptional LysR family regulator